MNSKFLTLSALLLFFTITINAQNQHNEQHQHHASSNLINFSLLVNDASNAQGFQLIAEDEQLISRNGRVNFNMKLDYESAIDTVTYFRLGYRFFSIHNGMIGDLQFGVTAPVIIPPVRKKNKSLQRNFNYPFRFKSDFIPVDGSYFVTIDLVKYETREDYLNDTGVKIPGPSITFKLITVNTQGSEGRSNFSVKTYPNPSTHEVIIEYLNTSSNDIPSKNTPLELVIFNNKGIKVSNHVLEPFLQEGSKSALYYLDVTHLFKGVYYCKLKHGKDVFTKTIVKE